MKAWNVWTGNFDRCGPTRQFVLFGSQLRELPLRGAGRVDHEANEANRDTSRTDVFFHTHALGVDRDGRDRSRSDYRARRVPLVARFAR